MLANVEAILLMCFRMSDLVDEGKANLGQIALCKAFATERGREVVKWGR
jgi:alkylation response protein AidB-like acyl-CoA dehydrogenase